MADSTGIPELGWATRQRRLALIGAVISLLGLAASVLAMISYPRSVDDQNPYAVVALIGAVLLTGCCLLNLLAWVVAVGAWRRDDDLDGPWWPISLVAHVVSYPAVLVGMYGMLAASALAGWSSPPGIYFGIAFLMIIFAQIIGGTQRLRRCGPPGTIPSYLRQLNARVQSQR
jgi:hypothetical protein